MANIFNRPMFRKGGKVRKEEDYVSYTDYGRSGVIYKDEKGKPLTKEEFFQMLDEQESREMKAGGGIMSGIRTGYQRGGVTGADIIAELQSRGISQLPQLNPKSIFLPGAFPTPDPTQVASLSPDIPSNQIDINKVIEELQSKNTVDQLYDEEETEGGATDVSGILTMAPKTSKVTSDTNQLPKKKGSGVTLEGKGSGAEMVEDDELQAVRDYVKTAKSLMPESDAVSNLLINLGLNLISQPKRGGTLATIAAAAQDPVKAFQKEKAAEKQTDVALISKGLDRLDDDDLGAITKRAKAGVKAGYFKTVDEGIKKELERIYEDDPYRKEKSPETRIQEAADDYKAQGIKSGAAREKAEFDILIAPKLRKKGYRIGDDIPRRKGKVDTSKLRAQTVYRDPTTNTYKLWNGTEFVDIKLED